MNATIRTALLALSVGTLSGCSWLSSWIVGTDNATPPAELRPIAEPITVERLWSQSASSGDGDGFFKLRPALASGQLFVAGYRGDVSAFDADSGQRLWRVDTDVTISAGVGLSDGLLLVGTLDGEVLALRRQDGSEVWRARVPSEVLAPPRGAEGVIVVRTVDGNFTGLDAATGERRWGFSETVPPLSLRGTSAPVLAQGVAVAGLDNGRLLILALADGTPLGQKVVSAPSGRTEIDRVHDIDAEPVIVDNVAYLAAFQGSVSALDLRGGNTYWQRDISSYSGLAADRQTVFVSAEDDSVWALARDGGGTLWRLDDLSGRRLSPPAVTDGYVVVGDLEGYLHWVDKISGRIRGRVSAVSDAIETAPLVRNDIVYVLGNDGQLSAFR